MEADRNRVSLLDRDDSDIVGFTEALSATNRHEHDRGAVCAECIPHLRKATDLYRGHFLEGFSVRDALMFEDWSRTTGEHFRLRAGEAFDRLANAQASTGDYSGAVAAVTRWIELDPLHEPAHRLLMLLHAWSGDRPGAITAYRHCVATLGRELEVAPLEETTELYEAILDEDLPPAPGRRHRVRVDEVIAPMTPGNLIDRASQLTTLNAELGQSRSGGRVVVITGEPWMGKTRLVEEFAQRSAEAGASMIRARGFRAERSLPFGVVAQLLRAMPQLPPETPPWALEQVYRLVPDLGPAGHDPAPSPQTHGETRLYDALLAIFALWTRPPSVAWVDDAQWCDLASASFLAFLANRIGQLRCQLVLSMRSGDPDLPSTLAELTRPGSGHPVIDLGPLSAEDLSEVCADRMEAERAVRMTGGVPLLVHEYLTGGPGDLATGVQTFVELHLAELGGLERQILAAAAVVGGVPDLDLIRSTSGRNEDEVVEAVEKLVGRELLRFSPDGQSAMFGLEAVERFVYESTSIARRRLLHRRAATALTERASTSTDARLVTSVARHLQMSGSDREAAGWYARAGDLAFGVFAHAEAEASYRLAQGLGHADPSRVRLSLARLYLLTGRYREAMSEFENVAATTAGAQAALAEHGIGEIHRRLGRFELSLTHFERASGDHPDPGRLNADWALLAHRSGDVGKAEEMAHRALGEALSSKDDSLVARAHHLVGIVTPDHQEARAHFEMALSLSANDPIQRMASLNGLARAMSRSGEFRAALPLVQEAVELAAKIGDRHRQAALLNHQADLHHHLAETRQAEHLVTESVRLFAEIEPDAWEPEIWLLTGW